jgi:serine/threonine-protein kinase RsbW
MATADPIVRLEFSSSLDVLEVVAVMSDQVGRLIGLNDDAMHWVTMAVRESVINAVRHGNQNDQHKRVFVEFILNRAPDPEGLTVRVRDEGEGFDPSGVADPLSPENVLKSGGRGVFLIRSFMDEVVLQRAPEGGMEIRMVKHLPPESTR